MADGGIPVIIQLLVQIALVLTGIILLTLLYFLVKYASLIYSPEMHPIGDVFDLPFSEIMESLSEAENASRAVIACNSIPPSVSNRFQTAGYTDCRTVNMVFGGHVACDFGCLGLGSCAKLCPNDAIILQKGMISISDSCDGCGICLSICPKKLISLIPRNDKKRFVCSAHGKIDAAPICQTARDGYLLLL